jgi:hypothetical protein
MLKSLRVQAAEIQESVQILEHKIRESETIQRTAIPGKFEKVVPIQENDELYDLALNFSDVNLHNVTHLTTCENYSQLHFIGEDESEGNRKPVMRLISLRKAMELLRHKGFVRISRFVAVNYTVSCFDPDKKVVIINKHTSFDVSDSYLKDVEKAFFDHL